MEHTYTVALAGNPNVGKSTVFNRLTGLRQHTGNWPGKTVERAEGYFSQAGQRFRLVDLPGTYSLAADSPEEEVAGAFLQSGQADAVIVVVDASCLRRGLILALQLRQQTWRLVLCVNLMDEAARRGVTPQIRRLGQLLDVPVVATAARSGKGLAELRHQAAEVCRREPWEDGWKLTYVPPVEAALGLLETGMSRRRAVALLWGSPPTEGEQSLWQRAQQRLGALSGQALRDSLTASVVALAEEIGRQCARCAEPDPHASDRRLDRLLTSRLTGFPVMLLLLGLVFYLTIQGANAPSRLLSRWLTALEEPLRGLLAGAPWWVQGAVVDGIYRTVAWVVAVMLPPMAIFFPLFTLLEDAGYLPRVAFCMDRCFRAAGACGRQSLTMAMGFGCNACGVTGCRIIASPRERLVAILTNCFVPCNGRFPTLIALIGLFFLGDTAGPGRSALAAAVFLGGHRVLRGHDAGHVQAAERHGAARTALLFFAGAAALSPASGGAGAGALPVGSDGVCAGTGADGDGPGGAADLGDGEHGRRGRLSAGAGRRGTVPAGTAHGAGRHGAAGLSAGLSRQ